jgi:hypothetical protein
MQLYRDGVRYLADGSTVQRWLCRDCGYRFTRTSCNSRDSSQRVERIHRQALNRCSALPNNRQAGIAQTKVMALAEVETRQEKAAGATQQDPKGAIVGFMWTLKQRGYRESTIQTASRQLTILAKRGANITNPESVKDTIAKQTWNHTRKAHVVAVYTLFLKTQGKTWEPPIYRPVHQIFNVPSEQEINTLIDGAGRKLSAYLQLLKETGCRSGELDMLRWQDVDFERGVVRITPEKDSLPRILPLSIKCLGMLKN